MLFLNKKDIENASRQLIQDAVKKAYFLFLGQVFSMPDRTHVEYNRNGFQNTLLFMPCFGEKYFVTKLVSVFPQAAEFGQPSVNGVVILSDSMTGQPLALMDGAALTAQRTGAVGGIGVDLLTKRDIQTAGIIGTGVQGLSQARYLLFNRKIKTLWISSLHPESCEKMAAIIKKEFPDVACTMAKNVEELIDACELVIAATTARTPVFRNDPEIVKGKTFISIGSFRPDMREFPDAVILNAEHIYVDTPFAAKESGDIFIPLEKRIITEKQIKPFAHLLNNPMEKSMQKSDQTCFYKSVGMALFDLTVASALYEMALKENSQL